MGLASLLGMVGLVVRFNRVAEYLVGLVGFVGLE